MGEKGVCTIKVVQKRILDRKTFKKRVQTMAKLVARNGDILWHTEYYVKRMDCLHSIRIGWVAFCGGTTRPSRFLKFEGSTAGEVLNAK